MSQGSGMESLRHVGGFRDFPYGDPDGPHLRAAVGKLRPELREVVARYLETAATLAATPTVVGDVLDSEREALLSSDLMTDGVWTWHLDLAFYVREYGIELPPEFIAHAERHGWRAPELTEQELIRAMDRM